MIDWRTEMSFAPRPGYGEGIEWVLLALKDTDKMKASYWQPQDYTNREGGWFGLRPGEEPIAWYPIEHPSKQNQPEPTPQPAAIPVVSLPAGMNVTLPPGIG